MNRPFSINDEGKTYLISYLEKHNFTDIVDTDDFSQYTHWDLEANYKGEKVIFEIKCRDCPSTKWFDTEICADKYFYLTNSPHKVILVTFYEDVWCMINVKTTPPTKRYDKLAQHSRRWDRKKELKHFVNWKLDDTIKLLPYE